jgi:EH domain-containing protein 1
MANSFFTNKLKLLPALKKILFGQALQTPRHRLDHLAAFVETHGRRLSHFLEVLFTYRKKRRAFRTKYTLTGFIISVLCGGAAVSLTFAKSVIKVRRKFAKP